MVRRLSRRVRRLICRWSILRSPLPKDPSERGGAVLEVAVSFPFFVMMVVAIMAAAWVSWVQAAAAVATLEAARASAYHQGESINPADGRARFINAVSGITSERSAGWLGAPDVHVNQDTRTVSIRLERGVGFSLGTISARHDIRTGTFTRIQDFFGGAPGFWE